MHCPLLFLVLVSAIRYSHAHWPVTPDWIQAVRTPVDRVHEANFHYYSKAYNDADRRLIVVSLGALESQAGTSSQGSSSAEADRQRIRVLLDKLYADQKNEVWVTTTDRDSNWLDDDKYRINVLYSAAAWGTSVKPSGWYDEFFLPSVALPGPSYFPSDMAAGFNIYYKTVQLAAKTFAPGVAQADRSEAIVGEEEGGKGGLVEALGNYGVKLNFPADEPENEHQYFHHLRDTISENKEEFIQKVKVMLKQYPDHHLHKVPNRNYYVITRADDHMGTLVKKLLESKRFKNSRKVFALSIGSELEDEPMHHQMNAKGFLSIVTTPSTHPLFSTLAKNRIEVSKVKEFLNNLDEAAHRFMIRID